MTFHYINLLGRVRGEHEYLVARMIDLAHARTALLNFIDYAEQDDVDAEIEQVYDLSDQIGEIRARLDRLTQPSDAPRTPDQN